MHLVKIAVRTLSAGRGGVSEVLSKGNKGNRMCWVSQLVLHNGINNSLGHMCTEEVAALPGGDARWYS